MGRLSEFLKERRDVSQEAEGKRHDRLREWRLAVKELFDQIESWLEEAKKEGLVVRRLEDAKEITEGLLGTYTLPVLELEFADNVIRLEPVGRNIVGAFGRIDIFTPQGTYMLVRTEPDKWYLVGRNGQKSRLTQELFEEFLIKIFSA